MSDLCARSTARPSIHVVAGVVRQDDGRVLVAQRPRDKPMAGAWEFPGGKLEHGEDRFSGLAREFAEELGIELRSARPLIRYRHVYPDLVVDFDVWLVGEWAGEPYGKEGQALGWELPEDLLGIGLLPADGPVIRSLSLPSVCAVTPDRTTCEGRFIDVLETVAHAEMAPLVVLRRPDLSPEELLGVAAGAACRFEETVTRLLLHGDPALLGQLILEPPLGLGPRLSDAVAGLHSPARYLPKLAERPVPRSLLFGASCHDATELKVAFELGADYAFLGPVNPTPSHPGQPGLGWDKFSELIKDLPLPVYAIGGVGPDDLETAWAAGAQGVAGISAFWPK